MTQAYIELIDHVKVMRSRWRTRQGLEGALFVLAPVIAVVAAAAMVDHVLGLGVAGRVLLHVMLWAVGVACLWRYVIGPLAMTHGDDYFAAMIEQRFPVLGNRFINAVQLGREKDIAAPRLVDAILTDALTAVDDIDVRSAAADRTLRRRAIAAAGVFLLLLVYVGLFGPAARTSFARVLMPFADIEPFTWTKLTVDPYEAMHVLEGEPLRVEAETTGRIPAEAWLRWTDVDHRRRAARMAVVDGTGRFAHNFAAVETGFSYHVTAGDAKSKTVQVVMDRRPRIDSMTVDYRYPAYSGLPDRRIEEFDGHLYGLPQTVATLTLHANKELESLVLTTDDKLNVPFTRTADGWSAQLTLASNTAYRLALSDKQGYEIEDNAAYTITLQQDASPLISFARPGRDIQRQPGDTVGFQIITSDDFGLGAVQMLAQINADKTPKVVVSWPNDEPAPRRKTTIPFEMTVEELGLIGGDQMQYWAAVVDRNNITGPGRAQTHKYSLIVLTPEQAVMWGDKQMSDYARVVQELIRLQRLNRAETAAVRPAQKLADRQGLIRRHTLKLADVMEKNAFPAVTIITELRELGQGPMVNVIAGLESYRDAPDLKLQKQFVQESLPVQDAIIESLESILLRLNRNEQARKALKRLKEKDKPEFQKVIATVDKLAKELDEFLVEIKDQQEKYEKMAKRDIDEMTGEDLKTLEEVEHRRDRWKKWAKDTVDEIAKLPDGFVKDSHLADDINTIFEEIEKKPRPKTVEIATPMEESVRALAQEVAEDLEIWMMDIGDNLKWVMEEPMEGQFEVPPVDLPDTLQDMIGDLIEDLDEFDEEADDMTSSSGGNMQIGWDVMDGPISSFTATGKTGNQLPNASEITGRAGEGRRGRSSGQMVGSEIRGMEGRPTPARLTKEPYEEGVVKAKKQLDPRGATGGGRKTGGGARGLQGGTPPDFVKDMERLDGKQKMLREKSQRVVRRFQAAGQTSWRLDRAMRLIDSAEEDLKGGRYADAARKRKVALSDLRALQGGVDQAVALELDKATDLPADMRKQITAGVQQALPEGFEELVGAYYKAISAGGSTSE